MYEAAFERCIPHTSNNMDGRSVAILACVATLLIQTFHGTSESLAIHAVKLVEEGLTPGHCTQHSLVNHEQLSHLCNDWPIKGTTIKSFIQ